MNTMENDVPGESGGAPTAFQKRVKRQVAARTHCFFAATAPGLEPLCAAELSALPLTAPRIEEQAGGVAFSGKLNDLYLANLHLRTANRVLMRLAQFRAEGFAALERKLADIPWELYLPSGAPPRVTVTAVKSRLYHTGAVAERVVQSVCNRFGIRGAAPGGPSAHIFVRAVANRFGVSLDSSGDLLYKRGVKTGGGRAPIRETLAAGILYMAGYRPGGLLLDPMCGSGAFVVEAAMMAGRVPAGWFRSFAFVDWPAFSPGKWSYLRRTREEKLGLPETPCVFASDAKDTLVGGLGADLAHRNLSALVHLETRDFFSLSAREVYAVVPRRQTEGPGTVVMNPPYGRRLGNEAEARSRYRDIFRKLASDFPGWRFAVIGPRGRATDHLPPGCRRRPLLHGGLPLVLLTGRIPGA